MLEKEVQKQVLEYLNLCTKILVWRTNSGGMTAEYKGRKRYIPFNGAQGHSDLFGVLPDGKALAIECKRPGGELTALQQGFLDKVNQSKGLGMVVDSVESLRKQLREAGYDVP